MVPLIDMPLLQWPPGSGLPLLYGKSLRNSKQLVNSALRFQNVRNYCGFVTFPTYLQRTMEHFGLLLHSAYRNSAAIEL